MRPTPAGFRTAGETPGTAGEVAGCLDGTVHLAYARASAADPPVVAAGFSAEAALSRARARARALGLLREGPAPRATPGGGGRALRLSDFVPHPIAPQLIAPHAAAPHAAVPHATVPHPTGSGGPLVAGRGLLTGAGYRLPGEVVWLREHGGPVEPTAIGVVDDCAPAGVADVLAHDAVLRWRAASRRPPLRITPYLGGLLPPGVAEAASGLGLSISAYVLPAGEVRTVLVRVRGAATTTAAACGRTLGAAVREAFLLAVAAGAQPGQAVPDLGAPSRLVAWRHEDGHPADLERTAVDADPGIVDEPAGPVPSGWAGVAYRRFGHEPILVEAGESREAVKVVCPGASCYRRERPGIEVPCPVR
ncbi:hypothetical protein [Microbispora sp. H13382]|uniref:hypothetical protein n=1 Tax=Microbispora sp. H13382 TaxID=2729112 RepID=UPI001601E2A8|nr:hypothetical protein [Microbispora sp. H13382]